MFKTIIHTDCENRIQPSFMSHHAKAHINESIVVVERELLPVIEKLSPSLVVVIGKTEGMLSFESLNGCIKYLSDNYAYEEWWIICGYYPLYDLIWSGAVGDIYVIKSKDMKDNGHIIDYTPMRDVSNKFEYEKFISIGDSSSVIHYFRINEEELLLLNALADIIESGSMRDNRTDVPTLSTFGKTFEYKMEERIDANSGKHFYRLPLLTTKKMFVRGIFEELKWFLSGQTDSKILERQGVNIWKGNSSREYLDACGLQKYDEGKCGPIYGHQWRAWNADYDQTKETHKGEGIDQVNQCIQSLKNDPYGRRHIVSGWNVAQLDDMALPPCHVLYQFYVHEKNGEKYLSLSMYQRSADAFLGVPFNVCSMSLFLLLMAHQVGYKPYKIVHMIGDMHVYANHVDAVNKQLIRTPNMFPFISIISDVKPDIADYEYNDLTIDGYISHSTIKADMVA